MFKKFIIENYVDGASFAILVIAENSNEGYRMLGTLKYFNIIDNKIQEVTDFGKNPAWEEISIGLIEIAEKICEENGATLWSY